MTDALAKPTTKLHIFGEVLFDCFENGRQVLGGAPFNIAWHCQAFGDAPHFISSIGQDALGAKILAAANTWGLNTQDLQQTAHYPTGQVAVTLQDDEPHYVITPDCAYDFIDPIAQPLSDTGILYHGSLALRNPHSRATYEQLCRQNLLPRFVDVNLRSPWWQKSDIFDWCFGATWVKLNIDELRLLGFEQARIEDAMQQCLTQFGLQQLIITRGALGAMVLQQDGQIFSHNPEPLAHFVDTVGAGDAFTAVYIHGLLADWPVPHILEIAQTFASQIIGLQGATTTDGAFYADFIRQHF